MADLQHLLTMAAKAAGIELGEYDHSVRTYESPHYGGPAFLVKGRSGHGMADYWNAATDDGDSRRLQVALHMTMAHEPSRGGWSVGAVVRGEFAWLAHDDDARLAVLRAAAAIGEAIP